MSLTIRIECTLASDLFLLHIVDEPEAVCRACRHQLPLGVEGERSAGGGRIQLHDARGLEPGRVLHVTLTCHHCLVALPHKVVPVTHYVHCHWLHLLKIVDTVCCILLALKFFSICGY